MTSSGSESTIQNGGVGDRNFSLYLCIYAASGEKRNYNEWDLPEFPDGPPAPAPYQDGTFVILLKCSRFVKLDQDLARRVLTNAIPYFCLGVEGKTEIPQWTIRQTLDCLMQNGYPGRERLSEEELKELDTLESLTPNGRPGKDDATQKELNSLHKKARKEFDKALRKAKSEVERFRNPSRTREALRRGEQVEEFVRSVTPIIENPNSTAYLDYQVESEEGSDEGPPFDEFEQGYVEKPGRRKVLINSEAEELTPPEFWDHIGTDKRMTLMDFAHGMHSTQLKRLELARPDDAPAWKALCILALARVWWNEHLQELSLRKGRAKDTWTKERILQVEDLVKRGWSDKDISDHLSAIQGYRTSPDAVRKGRKRHGI